MNLRIYDTNGAEKDIICMNFDNDMFNDMIIIVGDYENDNLDYKQKEVVLKKIKDSIHYERMRVPETPGSFCFDW